MTQALFIVTLLLLIVSVITKRGIIQFFSIVLAALGFSYSLHPFLFNRPISQLLVDLLGQIQGIAHWVFTPPAVIVLLFLLIMLIPTELIREGDEALVERLGRFHRKLLPGLNFRIIPFVDQVIVIASVREQILEVDWEAITKDNVVVQCDITALWRVFELEKANYAIEDVGQGIRNLVGAILRFEVGQRTLQQTNDERDQIIRTMLESLDEATEPWGVKITRVEIQEIRADDILIAMQKARMTESQKHASIEKAKSEGLAAIQEAEATAESIRRIARVLPPGTNSQDILRYLTVRQYIAANRELAKSNNTKVVFFDTRVMNDTVAKSFSEERNLTDGSRSSLEAEVLPDPWL